MRTLISLAALLTLAIVHGQVLIKSDFSCQGRPSGYYADVQAGCQIYHMCDGLGRQFSYSCPNTTLFQQRMLICDHWYMVNCSKSEVDYSANLLIGQREKPFVEDSEKHPYHRTPRPDLLSHPSAPEFDIIYRTGRAQYGTNLNLVGVDSDASSTTDKPAYSLPSHWSTEYYKDGTTPLPLVTYTETSKQFKPTKVPQGFQPSVNKKPNNFAKTKPIISNKNFEQTNEQEQEVVPVNYRSAYKNTTPVFPTSVDVTPPSIAEDQLPPLPEQSQPPSRRTLIDIIKPPSKFYEPPRFEAQVPNVEFESQTASAIVETTVKSNVNNHINGNRKQNFEWTELRRRFLIPDYEFPLEQASRPSYDETLSSFQVNPFVIDAKIE